MKNKALKHYKRKKFFYRFFMRKSPRSSAMFGIAWLSIVAALMPAILFLLLAFGDVISDIDSAHINLLTVILGILTVSLPLFIYGFKLCFLGIYRMFRSVCKYKSICRISGASDEITTQSIMLIGNAEWICHSRLIVGLIPDKSFRKYPLSQRMR